MAIGTDLHCYYQRGVNWAAVSGINYVWVKVSDGASAYTKTVSGVTYRPDTHVAGAKSRGLPVGGYHYAELNPAPEVQADVLVSEIRRLGATGVAPLLDLEAPFAADATAKAFAIKFCNRVAAAGFRPAVYMSSSFAKALRPDQWGIPGLVIVIARYGAVPEAAGSAQYLGRYDVHQYSSSGSLPGSAGAVDLDDSRNNNHLTQGDDMPTAEDLINAEIIPNRLYPGKLDSIATLLGWTNAEAHGANVAIGGLSTSLASLTKMVVDDEANAVTADSLAAALVPAVLPQLTQALHDAVGTIAGVSLTPEQIQALAAATVAAFGAKLT